MSAEKWKLKYLFKVDYFDGSHFFQPQDDHSELEPKKSAFYDVLETVKAGKKIRRFSLIQPRWLLGHRVVASVDLITGLFTINGREVQVDDPMIPALPKEIIFYRQHEYDTNVTYGLKEGDIRKSEPGAHRCKYFIGWQCNIGGKNYKQIVGVA